MKFTPVAVALTALVAGSTFLAFAPKPKIKPCVEFARTWENAVKEAKLLNLPIVVHSHGFYCGPCWGMHAAVLQNEDYIKFASTNTVEVVCLGSLEDGVKAGDKKAEKYEVVENGKKVERMLEWPNLTYDEMIALNSSPGSQYNDTGRIPYTCIVDPYTLKQVWKYSGGTGASSVEEAVKEARKSLDKEHGKGIPRKEYRGYLEAEGSAVKLTTEGEYAKAIAALESAAKNAESWPQEMVTRHGTAKQQVIDSAAVRLDEIDAKVDTDAVNAKRDLDRVSSKLKGTGLEPRVKEIAQRLAAG